MKLYNTLSRRVEELEPQNNIVRMYVCGVTVYDNSHIGHARTVIVFDMLRRYLLSKGHKVVFVQNFTDVDDKIINRAKAEGKKAKEISEKYIDNYFRDFSGLNVMQRRSSSKGDRAHPGNDRADRRPDRKGPCLPHA